MLWRSLWLCRALGSGWCGLGLGSGWCGLGPGSGWYELVLGLGLGLLRPGLRRGQWGPWDPTGPSGLGWGGGMLGRVAVARVVCSGRVGGEADAWQAPMAEFCLRHLSVSTTG
jgi:hypothetical protein